MSSRRPLLILAGLFTSLLAFSQQQIISIALTSRLDSIRMCPGKERHFAELYFQTTLGVEDYMKKFSDDDKTLMKRLEDKFANYFFKAIEANNNRTEIPQAWKNYFDGSYSPLQLKLIGANAHINGDIWQALTNSFTLEEIQMLKPSYKKYNNTIVKIYDQLFEQGIRSDKRLHRLHLITFGFDRVYGRMMLKKWRNRQLKLAILKFENPVKFNQLKKRIDHKRKRIDNMIIHRLHVKE